MYPTFFGDWTCHGSGKLLEGHESTYTGCMIGGFHHSSTHWGYRHWLFFFMGLVLFVFQAINIIQSEIKRYDSKID
jgi:hypothetical protein